MSKFDVKPSTNANPAGKMEGAGQNFDELYALAGNVAGTGVLSGLAISVDGGNLTYSIEAGTARHVDNWTDPGGEATITLVDYAGSSGNAPAYLNTGLDTQVFLTSSGVIFEQQAVPSAAEFRDYIYLGKVVHSNKTTINAVVNIPVLQRGISSSLVDIFEALGTLNLTGNAISANGANLSLDRSAGTALRFGANNGTSAKSPNVLNTSAAAAFQFRYRYRDGSGEFVTSAFTSLMDPDNYDTGTGTPVAVLNNRWTVQRLYYFPGSANTSYLTYGQSEYLSKSAAIDGVQSEAPIVDSEFTDAILLAYIAVKKGAVSLQDTADSLIIPVGKFGTSLVGSGVSISPAQSNTVYAGPVSGGDALPVFRSLAGEDTPVTYGGQTRPGITNLTGGAASDLDGIATVGVATGLVQEVLLASGPTLSKYALVAGTDAENAPSIVRPDDYAPTTNEKVWKVVLQ